MFWKQRCLTDISTNLQHTCISSQIPLFLLTWSFVSYSSEFTYIYIIQIYHVMTGLIFCHKIWCFLIFAIFLQERIQLETSRLYKQAGVNPLAGYILTYKFTFVFLISKVMKNFVFVIFLLLSFLQFPYFISICYMTATFHLFSWIFIISDRCLTNYL